MTTQRNTKSPTLQSANKTIRNWVIVFSFVAAINIVANVAGSQNVIATAVMLFAAAMVVVEVHRRENIIAESSAVRVTNG